MGLLDLGQGFVMPSQSAEQEREAMVCWRVPWAQLARASERALRRLPVPVDPEADKAQRGLHFRFAARRIEAQRVFRGGDGDD